MIGLAIGLLVETTCIVKQHQTIFRQQQEILCLNQRLTQKKAQTENVQLKTFPPPTTKPVPATEKKESMVTCPQQLRDTVLLEGKVTLDIPKAEQKISASPTGNPESENTQKEESHNEMR